MNNSIKKAQSATKAIFLVCGLGVASWAPMVPYAKERLQLNDADLGILLLLLGGGAITMMPVSGLLPHRYGSRLIILFACLLMAATLPLLLIMTSPIWMGVTLFIFGSAVGTVDVAMNAHGVQVQNLRGTSIMSSLHGLFSVGGLVGSLGLGILMKLGLPPIPAAIVISIVLIVIAAIKYRSLLDFSTEKDAIAKFSLGETKPDSKPKSTFRSLPWLHGSVLFLGAMCFASFLSEGAMLDWSAIFLRENRGMEDEFAGTGYAAFSIAMATMRLFGDRIISRISSAAVVIGGGILGAAGLFLVIFTPWIATAILGFILLGFGAANIVPVFFSEGGRLKNVSAAVAIPAITTMGYAGQLAGPALLGFIAYHFSLPMALGFCAFLLLVVAIAYALRGINNKSDKLIG